jgi:hypothetical protein
MKFFLSNGNSSPILEFYFRDFPFGLFDFKELFFLEVEERAML